ncbi:toxin [Bacteroidia bacterium]|nr:toxin [Bacteroidia bacterium]
MKFEFDEEKSRRNKEKHGIDFIDAQKLWYNERYNVVKLNYELEDRYAVTAPIEDKFWTAIITFRSDKIRIISVRRAHKNEETRYDTDK